jgi:hypothetical protein
VKNIKKLGSLLRKHGKLAEELTTLNAEIASFKNMLGASLKEGTYQADSWVCVIKDKFIKGKETPSWKTVATTIKNTLDQIKYDFVQKYPESTEAINKMAKRLHKLYDETLLANTNIGEDKTNIDVHVEKLVKPS